jgi:ABC-type multidrug transport system fused ATPase/permease subunit
LILDEATSAIDVRTERIVQQALDRVSKNRTTIVIAHRLSTIKRADKIVVLRKGGLVEEGSHEELLNIENGVYYGLVHAQDIALEAEEQAEEEIEGIHRVKTTGTERSENAQKGDDHAYIEDPDYKNQDLLRSFGRLIAEQRHHWILYSLIILGVLAAGAVYPIQAFIFANIINVFTLVGQPARFVSEGNFWAGMFGVEAAGMGVAYYVIYHCAHLVSNVSIRSLMRVLCGPLAE